MILETLIRAGGAGSGPTAPCPSCGPHLGHKLVPGDTVKTKAEIKLWNQKTGNIDTLPVGSKVKLVNVLPKIGTGDQMVSVAGVKHHDPEYMKMNDVEFHKLGNKEQIEDIKPVSKSKTILKFNTADGATVTWVRPHTETEKEPQTIKTISEKPHYLKGDFNLIDSVQGKQDRPGTTRVTKIYDTTGLPSHLQTGSNATLWVNTYSRQGKIKNVVIQEQNTTNFSQKTRGVIEFNYKNTAAAVGMLKSRYGIKTTMARLSKAKFGG